MQQIIDDPVSVVQPLATVERHSGLGIASFVISLIMAPALLVIVVMAALIGSSDDESPANIIVGLLALGSIALLLTGIGLGIAGVLQKQRRRMFSVLGLVFNASLVLGILGLMLIGLMME
jgi:hypothetical protein